MSRESLNTSQTQPAGGASITEDQAESWGLRRELYAQIMQLSPADADALAEMLSLYSERAGAILQVAASHMGNAAVQRAMAILKQRRATQGRAGSMDDHAQREMITDASDRTPIPPRDRASFLEYPSERPAQASAATDAPAGPAVKQAPPAWVAAARAYNGAHPEFVDEFNDLTANVCCGDDNELDPQAVARWQEHHGLPADGKIGPHTLAVARAAKSPVAGPSPAPAIPV